MPTGHITACVRAGPGPVLQLDREPDRIKSMGAMAGSGRRPYRSGGGRPAPFRRGGTFPVLSPSSVRDLPPLPSGYPDDPAYAHPALSFLILGGIVQLFSLLYLSTLIFAGSRLAEAFRRRRRLAAGLTGVVGAAFMAFSARLATASIK